MRRSQPAHAKASAQELDFRTLLLDWYRNAHRDLPWRRTSDPYAIWVSEIMLQQTRVETVVPYFNRFLDSFPTVEALAEAPLEQVLERWSGLGYYRRARMLHAGARAVASTGMPETAATLRAIPGIGEYTAGAIASIAFGEESAIVDGNVARVLSRLHAIRGEGSAVRKRLWAQAAELVRGEDPGALNQALMELGATVCTPRAPSCEACPLAKGCRALAEDLVDSIPPAKKRARVKAWKRVAIVAERGGTVLMARRKTHLVFGGLWEPPGVDGSGARAVRTLAARFASGTPRRAGTVRHLLSHRDLRVDVWIVDRARALRSVRLPPDYDEHTWARSTEGLALSTLAKKILAIGING
jgi:A/G-specific adenine glycosylase